MRNVISKNIFYIYAAKLHNLLPLKSLRNTPKNNSTQPIFFVNLNFSKVNHLIKSHSQKER